jgi:hypothetical protein
MKFLTTLLLALFVAMVLPVSTQAKEYQEGK